jgi:hypothetical protein
MRKNGTKNAETVFSLALLPSPRQIVIKQIALDTTGSVAFL